MAKWTVADIPSLEGHLAVVTGANSGIGWHVALELARAGSEVILAVRTDAKGQDAIARIRREVPQARIRAELLDLARLKSVRSFADRVSREPKLDLLVNNAAVMSVPQRRVTEDGFELQLGTNHLGPFALTGLLLPVLLRAVSPRVTTVSSGAANMGMKRILFEDLQLERSYGPWNAYCQTKLANLLFTRELSRRVTAAGIALLSNAAHPGYARTNIATSGPGKPESPLVQLRSRLLAQDAAHGALPILRAATENEAGQASYYAPDQMFQMRGDPILVPFPNPAQAELAARRLWDVSEALTGVCYPPLATGAEPA